MDMQFNGHFINLIVAKSPGDCKHDLNDKKPAKKRKRDASSRRVEKARFAIFSDGNAPFAYSPAAQAFTCLAKVSRRPTVRLNTGLSAVESGSLQK